MKNKTRIFAIMLIAAMTFSCGSNADTLSGNQKKLEKNLKEKNAAESSAGYETPKEVLELIMPDGWSDETLNKIGNEEEIKKPVMAIMDFQSNVGIDLNIADIGLNDMLTKAMFDTGKFDLVERDKLNLVMKEQRLSNSDEFDASTAAEIGALLGANYIITGKVVSAIRNVTDEYAFYSLKAQLQINISIIEVSTGKIFKVIEGNGVDVAKLYLDDRGNVIKGPAGLMNAQVVKEGTTYTVKGVNMEAQFVGAVKAAMEDTSAKLEATFPLTGYCLGTMPDGQTFMTDVNSGRGLKKGDYFIVVRLGNEIRHPKTKKVISVEKTVLASGIVESVGDTDSVARLVKVKTEGDLPISGDIVVSISGRRGN